MKFNIKKQTISKKDHIRSLLLVFGACLGLFTVSSFNSWNSAPETLPVEDVKELVSCNSEAQSSRFVEINDTIEPKAIMHRNFIASYLLQESSFERKSKKTNQQHNFFSHLKQLRKIIGTQTFGSL